MRALLITKEGVKEVEIGPDVERTYALIANRPLESKDNANLKSMYRLMECDTVTGCGSPDAAHVCWADDEGLFNLYNGKQVNIVSWYPEKLVGKLLVTGFDPKTGDTTPATMSVEELESMIKVGAMYYG